MLFKAYFLEGIYLINFFTFHITCVVWDKKSNTALLLAVHALFDNGNTLLESDAAVTRRSLAKLLGVATTARFMVFNGSP